MGTSKKCSHCLEVKDIDNFDERNGSRRGTYYPVCKECRRNKNYTHYKVIRDKKPFVLKCYAIKDKSKRQNIPFNITPEYLESLWTGKCEISGVDLSIYNTRGTLHAAEVDRINPHLGYTIGNVAWVSAKFNRIKCNASIGDLELIINYIKRMKDE